MATYVRVACVCGDMSGHYCPVAVDWSAIAVVDDAWGSVWLHGKWSWLTKNMTTEQREYAADCVARWNARLAEIDGEERGEPEGLRWWRDA